MRREGLLDFNEAVQNPGKTLRFEVSTELPTEENIDITSPIVGTIEGVSTGNILLIDADLKATVVVECARCAEPVEVDLEFEMEDEFPVEGVPSMYGSDGFALVKPDEDYELFVKNSLLRDIYVRQGLLVNLPTQAICERPECQQGESVRKYERQGEGHPAMRLLEQFRTEDEKE